MAKFTQEGNDYEDVGGIGEGDTPTFSLPGGGTAGGINPKAKLPTNAQLTNPAKPYYYSTDDWQLLLRMNSKDVTAVQQKLMKAYPGFKPATLGDRYDPQTVRYFKQALSRINQYTFDPADPYKIRGKATIDALDVLAKNPVTTTTGRGGGATYTYRKSASDDLKSVFQQVAQRSLGRDLDEGTVNRMVEAFQQQEVQYQRQATRGGVVTQAPTAETFAQNKIQNDFGTEVDTRKLDNIFGAIDAAMMSGGQ